jgi:Predicted NADH:ubiquinone oxidoreductase, subunit RnfC
MAQAFFGGVHPNDMKAATNEKAIEQLAPPAQVVIPMANSKLANGTGVLDQFVGKSTSDQPLKVGGNVDAISGATVSSKGVTKGVNGALAVVAAIG